MRANSIRQWCGLRARVTALLLLALLSLLMSVGAGADDAPVRAEHAMIAAAHPAAAEAGARILEAGGGAIDAAIAAQMVLGLVEPQSSGVGGGGFLLYYDAARGVVETYDGRETAPAAADERFFWMRTAHRALGRRSLSAAFRSECQASSGCSNVRTAPMAACLGHGSSSPLRQSPSVASAFRRGWRI